MKNLINLVLERATEKSTWLTLFTLLATVGGVTVTPELQNSIIGAGMGVVSIIAIVTKEHRE